MAFFFALVTALLWGIAPVLEKAGLRGNIDPLVAVVIRSLTISFVGLLTMLMLNRLPQFSQISIKNVMLILLGGLIAGFFAQWTYYHALKMGQASTVVPVAAIYPLVALFLSVLFLGESITWLRLVGVVLVVAGVILIR